ncbi:hypothetical protein H7J88_15935 [Mycolicibacterium flavescens]|uniref:Secreted protein n=1 Tax=Mycolicibacterium flavescens TaxID=1776 RepID=A0A1E3RJ64_MYCFV|nr:hypothetical protein [Mycolicibacterium flavescens]MCV7281135.1 hypothetical protein [Mycolicibacterium flavescens]ODQ89880.1 hypothetical protein BHQ18_13355 [Mycolicibacterium flavescens]
MRGVGLTAGAAAITLLASLGTATSAHANDFGVALNGTYRVLSDGDWAQVGMAPGGALVFIDQQTVVQTWTVSTQCVSPIECVGEVKSDRGWTGTVRLKDYWYIDHDIPNWLPCPDGTFAPGHQKYILTGWDAPRNERNVKNTNFLMGREATEGPTGACGRNQPLVIEIPVRMERI